MTINQQAVIIYLLIELGIVDNFAFLLCSIFKSFFKMFK